MDRKKKLKALEKRIVKKKPVGSGEIENGLKQFNIIVERFKSVMDAGTELNNLDDLIVELAKIDNLKPVVESLEKSIKEYKPPKYSDTIKIAGLSDLIKAVNKPTKPVDLTPLKEISKHLNGLTKAITDIKVPDQGQQPSDYVPMRRVMKVGNTLMWDDSFYTGGGGGGGGGVGQNPGLGGNGGAGGVGYCIVYTY